ncbi:hypothetical protein [Sphingomonas sp. G-3-2-10]|uniref:hypothetical protein n=1 Tax=Sphingomonas sp. G-3-2-10 TaxID=2728838 RepID=UPI00146E4764|nr:hypothetical protein [Sphingomonas sp. G-3-2-10]NML05567.1 hypothetical protein [Sphingomonas sp. G-3-2-10]
MLIYAMIWGVALTAAGAVVALFLWAPEMMVPLLFGGAAITAAMLRLLLARFAPQWQSASATGAAAIAFPSALWLIAFAADLTAIIQNQLDPAPGFMIGFSIMLFLPCLMSVFAGFVAAWLAGRLMRLPR